MENEKQNEDYTELNLAPCPPNVKHRSGQTSSGQMASDYTELDIAPCPPGQMASLVTDVQKLDKKLVRLVVPLYVLFGICLVVLVVFLGLWVVSKHAGNDEIVTPTISPTAQTKSPKRVEKITTVQTEYSTGEIEVTTEAQQGFVDCQVYRDDGRTFSGVYVINLYNSSMSQLRVYCDMETNGGGWTVLLRREDGSVDFERNWAAYKNGFGDLSGEFWAGNEVIHQLTSRPGMTYRLRVEIGSYDNQSAYAEYDVFRVDSEQQFYRLHVSGYHGTAGDSLNYHDNMMFSTVDQDHDTNSVNCAASWHAGHWFGGCHQSLLTGRYGSGLGAWHGIIWKHWLGASVQLKTASMMVRPV